MTPLEKYESVHGVDSFYEPKPRDKTLKYLKYLVLLLIGFVLGYLVHILLLRVSL